MEKKRLLILTILGYLWVITPILVLIASLIYRFAPKEFIPPDFQGFDIITYILCVMYLVIGVSILKLYKWAWIAVILLSIGFLLRTLWIAIVFKQYLVADFFFSIIHLAVFLPPKVKEQFK